MLGNQEQDRLVDLLVATAEVIGDQLSPNAAAYMVSDLAQYPLPMLERALASCRRELKARLSLAAILERIEDGHPAPNEAWANAIRAADEGATVVWTEQTRDAWAAALPLVQAGDKIAARPAFLEVYTRLSARMPAGDGKVASAEALDAVSTRVEETEEGIRAVGDRTSSLEAQVTYKHAGDRDWNAGDRDVRAGVKTWQSVIAQGDRAVAKQVDSVRAELGEFEATATRSIEVIATEQSAQAVQIQHLGVELDGKASADYVEEISARVNVTEHGIEAVTGQLASVKAEVAGKASAQVVQGMEARVIQTEGGLAQVMAKAFLHLIADSGNGPLIGGMELGNDGNVVSLRFLTNSMEILAPNGASEGMEWRNGYLRVWKGAAQRIIGASFGAAGDNLIDYFGPNVGAGAASKANAVMWMDASGSAYFGGQLSAGILRNAVQTTTTQTVGVELVNGPFATNGRVRSVTVSFSRRHVRTKTTYGSDGFVAGGGQNTARVEIYRRVGEGAESLWQVLNASGGVNILNETDGPDNAISDWGGSFTVNDTSTSAQTMTYRAVITSFTEQTVSHTSGSFQQQSITQSLSIISVEN